VDLSHWLKRRGLPVAKLDEARLKQFHARHRGSRRRGDVSTGHQLLALLRRLGVVPALSQGRPGALGQLTRDYERSCAGAASRRDIIICPSCGS
jgi:hypothetical protein